MEGLARLQTDLDFCWQHTAVPESSMTGVHKKLAQMTAKISDLKLCNATVRKDLERLFTTQAEA